MPVVKVGPAAPGSAPARSHNPLHAARTSSAVPHGRSPNPHAPGSGPAARPAGSGPQSALSLSHSLWPHRYWRGAGVRTAHTLRTRYTAEDSSTARSSRENTALLVPHAAEGQCCPHPEQFPSELAHELAEKCLLTAGPPPPHPE